MIVKHEIIVLFTSHLSLSFLYHYVSLSIEAVHARMMKNREKTGGREGMEHDGIQPIPSISLLVKICKGRYILIRLFVEFHSSRET